MNAFELSTHTNATAAVASPTRTLRAMRSSAASTNPYDTTCAVKKKSRVTKCAAVMTSIQSGCV